MMPFWSGDKSFWTSDQVRGLSEFNYTYPEFVGLDLNDQDGVKSAISHSVNSLYGPSETELAAIAELSREPGSTPASADQVREIDHPRHVSIHQLSERLFQVTIGHTRPPAHRDWTVRVRSHLQQFGTSYSILIFVGEPPEHEHDWRTSPNYVGAFCPFVNTVPGRCSNCQERADAIVEGYVPLTRQFCRRKEEVRSLHPTVVEPYLKEHIHWRIQKVSSAD